jgi:hypothetical protein
VIRLLEFSSSEVYVHSMSAITSSNPVRHSVAPFVLPKTPKYATTRPEVHVTTEHITMAEFPYVHSPTRSIFDGSLVYQAILIPVVIGLLALLLHTARTKATSIEPHLLIFNLRGIRKCIPTKTTRALSNSQETFDMFFSSFPKYIYPLFNYRYIAAALYVVYLLVNAPVGGTFVVGTPK